MSSDVAVRIAKVVCENFWILKEDRVVTQEEFAKRVDEVIREGKLDVTDVPDGELPIEYVNALLGFNMKGVLA
jgi:hypothetical protein